jgi:hypothetical protein
MLTRYFMMVCDRRKRGGTLRNMSIVGEVKQQRNRKKGSGRVASDMMENINRSVRYYPAPIYYFQDFSVVPVQF